MKTNTTRWRHIPKSLRRALVAASIIFLTLVVGVVFGYDIRPIGTELRKDVPAGRIETTKEIFRQSPYILDTILSGPTQTVFYRRPAGQLEGTTQQSWRVYATGESDVHVKIKFIGEIANRPRVWLYDELGHLIQSTIQTPGQTESTRTYSIKIPKFGMYKIAVQFNFEDVSEIQIDSSKVETQYRYADYLKEYGKTISLVIPQLQLGNLYNLLDQADRVWSEKPPNDVFWPRYAGISGRVFGKLRTSSGDDVHVAIGLSGRSKVHLPEGKNPLPSLDIKVLAGPMPYQLRRFKLYAPNSKNVAELVHTTMLQDYGILSPRQDRVNVILNGTSVGQMLLLESPDIPFFAAAQQFEGPVFGYDPDGTSARFYDNTLAVQNFSNKRFVLDGEMPNLSDPGFIGKLNNLHMMLIQSYGLTYAAYHGLGQGDMRYHWNARTAAYNPMVRDLDAGIIPPTPGQLLGAWLYFNPLAPSWRPNAVTIASYYLKYSNSGREIYKTDIHDKPIFLWHTPPSTLSLLEGMDNQKMFSAFSRMWASDWSRDRIQSRLDNLIQAIGNEAAHPPIRITQDDIVGSIWEQPVRVRKNAVRRLGRLINKLTKSNVVPSENELATLEMRNDKIRHFADKRTPETELASKAKADKWQPTNFLAFLYRYEEPDQSHIIFVERLPKAEPTNIVLKSKMGKEFRPINSQLFDGEQKIHDKYSMMLNDIAENEAVRLYWFRIDREAVHQYIYPEIKGEGVALTPREMVILPKPQKKKLPPSPSENILSIYDLANLDAEQNNVTIDQTLTIDRNQTLNITSDTKMEFTKSGCLMVYGDLKISPDANLSLVARSSEEGWSGVHFFGGPDKEIRNITIEGVGVGEESVICGGRSFTGGVSFYNTRVSIDNLTIRNMRLEDALHLLRSEVSIENMIVENTLSDCLDSDFSALTIKNSEFISCGGDGIDASGSLVSVFNNTLIGSVDKNISVGENSKVFVLNSRIEKGRTGIAVKDGSDVHFKNNLIEGNVVGVAAYSKKPYFPLPTFTLDNETVFKDNATDISQ